MRTKISCLIPQRLHYQVLVPPVMLVELPQMKTIQPHRLHLRNRLLSGSGFEDVTFHPVVGNNYAYDSMGYAQER